jgi:pimeloyl-ACP methyl ester carboxylesterase
MEHIPICVDYAGDELTVATRQRRTSDELILFVHGLGCSQESFAKAFEAPELHDFSICTFDFIGFGDSDQSHQFSYDLQAQADILIQVVRNINAKRLHVVAHSMGGAIGLLAAQRLPQLYSFFNVEGNLVSQDAGLVSRQVAEQTEQSFIESGFDEFVHKLETSKKPDLLAWAVWCQQSDPKAFYWSARSLVHWSDSGELLKLLQSIARKAYVHGEKTDCSYLDNPLKKIKRYSIPAAGHFMMMDNPKDFYKSLADWLKSQ